MNYYINNLEPHGYDFILIYIFEDTPIKLRFSRVGVWNKGELRSKW